MATSLTLNATQTNAGDYGNSDATLEYKLKTTDYTTSQDVNDWLRSNLPSTHTPVTGTTFYREKFTSTPIGGGIWEVSAKFGNPKAENIEAVLSGPQYSYDGGTTTEILVRAIKETRYSRSSGSAAIDMKKNINWTNQGIEGVSIPFPHSSFTLTKMHAANTFTVNVLRDLRKFQMHVNSDTWKGWAPGEILFESFTVNRREDGKEQSVAKFVFSPNYADVNLADADSEKPFPEFPAIPKKGHEYLWVDWIEESDSSSGKKYKKPLGVYVNKVYKTASFTANMAIVS